MSTFLTYPRSVEITVFSEEDVRNVYATLARFHEPSVKPLEFTFKGEAVAETPGVIEAPKKGRGRPKKMEEPAAEETPVIAAEVAEEAEVPSIFDLPETDDFEDSFETFSDEVEVREWSDTDLSKLCNQAAQKLGNPAPIKVKVAEFTPEGEIAHSRNIPVDKREAFAQAIEEVAGIKFAG